MIQSTYKKGNRLAWTGFLLGITFAILEYLGTSTATEGSVILVPSLEPFVPLFLLARLLCIALIIWGDVLALKSKNRSRWWLLSVVPALGGGGIIFAAIPFMLKDKSAATPSVPSTPSSTPAPPQ